MRLIERTIEDSENDAVILEYFEFTQEFSEIKDFILERGNQFAVYRDDKTLVKININDILYFEAVRERVFAYTKDGIFEVKMRLYQIEEELMKNKILRASKAFLINLYHISSVTPALNSRLVATMDNGEKILVSRQYSKIIINQFMKGLVY